jgi:CRISPR-associated protein Cmr2
LRGSALPNAGTFRQWERIPMTTGVPQAALLVSIGPVQDFIATARKGQDLWFGSWLLSDLARAAAEEVQAQGGTLIMPAPTSLQRMEPLANKIVARVDAPNAVAVANAADAAVRRRLDHLAYAVLDRVARSPEGKHLRRDEADRQVADLPEIAWVVVDELPGDWGETRRRAEAALASRKSLRDFAPVAWGASVPKSRLDGQRESVIDEAAFPKPGQEQRAERLRQSFGVGRAERLCGVGLLKRNGRHALTAQHARGSRVISTAHTASWSLRRAWRDLAPLHAELAAVFGRFVGTLPDQGASVSEIPAGHEDPVLGRVDGAVLYAGRLAEDYDGNALLSARRGLNEFLHISRVLVEQNGGRWRVLSPYYAVLRADGDRMGAWLDGLTQPEDHQRASEALAAFAGAADGVVTQHHGHCVFAGGDDVLALLPVATALECGAALNVAFNAAIGAGPMGRGAAPTLSVGVQIAHAMDPFRESLNGARDAEHAAKHSYGRAAFAVGLDKRSGAPVLVGGKWEELGGLRALQVAQDPSAGSVPRGLAYDLRRVADRLKGDDPALNAIRALEVERVLRQKDINGEATTAIWARLGSRDLSAERLSRACDELIVTRALAALDGEEA